MAGLVITTLDARKRGPIGSYLDTAVRIVLVLVHVLVLVPLEASIILLSHPLSFADFGSTLRFLIVQPGVQLMILRTHIQSCESVGGLRPDRRETQQLTVYHGIYSPREEKLGGSTSNSFCSNSHHHHHCDSLVLCGIRTHPHPHIHTRRHCPATRKP